MGKFEIYTDKSGEHRFRLKAGNGQIILASEGYSNKNGCENGVESVKKNAQDEARFEKKETPSWYRFNLKSSNGQVIGSSETYTTEDARDNGIASVMKNAPDADIIEE